MRVFSLDKFKQWCDEIGEPFNKSEDDWAIKVNGKQCRKVKGKDICTIKGYKVMIEEYWTEFKDKI